MEKDIPCKWETKESRSSNTHVSVCLIYFDVVLLGICTLRIVTYSWNVDPFVVK